MSARPWDSVKAFAVTSIETCLLAKNEATVEKNQNPLFVEMEGGNWRDLHFMTAWYYILCPATSVYPQ